jgi:retron-type reverse transcriptase
VTPRLILWIVQFLVNRTQSVHFLSAHSSVRHTSAGAPQGTVISPVLFTLYTNDCRGTNITPVIKYSDDTAIEDLSNTDSVSKKSTVSIFGVSRTF